MTSPNTPRSPDNQRETSLESIQRRREALRRIGRSAAAAGAASPLAALASASVRPWCWDKAKTKKVHSSVSGMNSVMMSAGPNEHYGKPASWYSSSANLPSAVSTNPKFRDVFSCAEGSYDSQGVIYNSLDGTNGCLFHKRVVGLCTNWSTTPEAGWITAYCNSAALYATAKFPYSTTQVQGFWTDPVRRADALTFFRNYLENA